MAILSPGLRIIRMPPVINASIMRTLTNLKKPDLFVKRVVTEENMIRTRDKK